VRGGGLLTLPFGWVVPSAWEFAGLAAIGLLGDLGILFSPRATATRPASSLRRTTTPRFLFAFLLGYVMFGEVPTSLVVVGAAIVVRRPVRVVARAPARLKRARDAKARRAGRDAQNALKVMMVRVSWMPGMVCHLFVDEMADIGAVLDVELDQEIIVAGRRIDSEAISAVGERVRHLVGFAEMTLDLDEEGTMRASGPPSSIRNPAKSRPIDKARGRAAQ